MSEAINEDLLRRGARSCTKLQPDLESQKRFYLLLTVESAGDGKAVVSEATQLEVGDVEASVVDCYKAKVKGTQIDWRGPAFSIKHPYLFCVKPEHLSL